MHIIRIAQRNFNFCAAHPKIFTTVKVTRAFSNKVFGPDFRAVFLGNSKFSVPSLHVLLELLDSSRCLTVVVSSRENLVGQLASSKSLNVILWEDFKSQGWTDVYDIGVVASFGYLIPKRVIQRCEKGILNVHASLLPKLRGASPTNWAIINGYEETGISIMNIAPHRFDTGPLLKKRKCRLDPHVRAPELNRILSLIGAEALKEVLEDLENSLTSTEVQREEDATLAPKLSPSLAHVKWNKCTALEVYNLFRGLYGSYKLNTFYGNRKVDLDDIGLVQSGSDVISQDDNDCKQNIVNEHTDFSNFYRNPVRLIVSPESSIWQDNYVPGQVLLHRDSLLVCCADRSWIFSNKVKVGTKWMTARDFQNGILSKNVSPHVFTSRDPPTVDENSGNNVKSSKSVMRS